jgi:hypothetical protein
MRDLQPELFHELTVKRLLRTFTRLYLASWEFPISRIRLSFGSARKEKAPIRPGDDCSRDVNYF